MKNRLVFFSKLVPYKVVRSGPVDELTGILQGRTVKHKIMPEEVPKYTNWLVLHDYKTSKFTGSSNSEMMYLEF